MRPAKKILQKLRQKPTVSVIISNKNQDLSTSLKNQTYKNFETIALAQNGNLTDKIKNAINRALGQYIIFLDEGDYLYPNALTELVLAVGNNLESPPDMIFSDHDIHNEKKEIINQFYKPGWSPDLIMVNNYIYMAVMYRKSALVKAMDDLTFINLRSFIYHASLKISEFGCVKHQPGILFSFQEKQQGLDDYEYNFVRSQAIARRGENAYIALNKYSVPVLIRNLDQEPLVSIIIPTCFKDNYIDACLKSIVEKSTYKNYEIVVLDNSRKGIEYAQNRLNEYTCRIVPIDLAFNWAQFNNIGAQNAKGDVYIFLNDDIEVISEDWLERLVSNAIRKEIGVVGPILLYPDRRVQHAGIFLTDGNYWSLHCFAGLPEDYTGYHNILHYQRNCLIMTGACHAISRKKFEEIGGYDESFSVIQNDVDFCLRLWQKGYYQLYLPEIQLFHKEMASRRSVPEGSANEMFGLKWKELIEKGDPFYNKYLSFNRNDFSPRDIPSTVKENTELFLKRFIKKVLPKPVFEKLKIIKNIISK